METTLCITCRAADAESKLVGSPAALHFEKGGGRSKACIVHIRFAKNARAKEREHGEVDHVSHSWPDLLLKPIGVMLSMFWFRITSSEIPCFLKPAVVFLMDRSILLAFTRCRASISFQKG